MSYSEKVKKVDSLLLVNKIRGLDLSFAHLDLSETSKPTASVVSGSVMSYVSGVEGQYHDDTLNSTNFAQAAANSAYNRKDMQNWYNYYKGVLETLGWVVEDFRMNELSFGGNEVVLSDVILDIMGNKVGSDAIKVITAALKGLQNDAGAIGLFDSKTRTDNGQNFQIGQAEMAGSDVKFTISGYYFIAERSTSNWLWIRHDSESVSLWESTQTMVLNTDVYGQVREQVIEKLGDFARTTVADIPLEF